MQYWEGTVTVTSGSASVVGVSTNWKSYIKSGMLFKILNEDAIYTIDSVSSDVLVILTENYAGSSQSGASYIIMQDITNLLRCPTISRGDKDWPYILEYGLNIIDGRVWTQNEDDDADKKCVYFRKQTNIDDVNTYVRDPEGLLRNGTTFSESIRYGTGTVSVENGSTSVEGSGTLWVTNKISVDARFYIPGDLRQYHVESVDSETEITLAEAYEGTTQIGASYKIYSNRPVFYYHGFKKLGFVGPYISFLTPTSAYIGQVITIYGSYFGSQQCDGFVTFNGTVAGRSLEWTEVASALSENSVIQIQVPEGATTGDVTVTVYGRTSNAETLTII